jgi:predicted MFS family arabinose efflux permease
MALAAGLAVGSNYYIQPLLATIAHDLGLASAAAAFLVTASQLAYLLGLVFLLPLGDLMDRRRLAVILMVLTALCLGLASIAPDFELLALAVVGFGLTSVVTQVLVTLAADLADPAQRGRETATVVSGALIGVLTARTSAGLIAQLSSWRVVYATAAVLVLLVAVALAVRLPRTTPSAGVAYRAALTSIPRLVVVHPELRVACVYGALSFAGFGLLWATLALRLAGPPYGYREGVIGLFGLVGVGGVLAANAAGRLVDRGRGPATTGVGLLAGAMGFAVLAVSPALAAVVVGVLTIDFASQLIQVTNQGTIFRIRGGVTSRLTTAYMSVRFAGGAVGSAAGGTLLATAGWQAACLFGVLLHVLGTAVWVGGQLHSRRDRLDRGAPTAQL